MHSLVRPSTKIKEWGKKETSGMILAEGLFRGRNCRCEISQESNKNPIRALRRQNELKGIHNVSAPRRRPVHYLDQLQRKHQYNITRRHNYQLRSAYSILVHAYFADKAVGSFQPISADRASLEGGPDAYICLFYFVIVCQQKVSDPVPISRSQVSNRAICDHIIFMMHTVQHLFASHSALFESRFFHLDLVSVMLDFSCVSSRLSPSLSRLSRFLDEADSTQSFKLTRSRCSKMVK